MRIFESVRIGPFRVGASQNLRLRPRALAYTHPGCPIRHQRQDTAAACARKLAGR